MQKSKLLGLLAGSIISLAVVTPVSAGSIAITKLPSYINNNSFKLSYSCLGCSNVQFYVNKHSEGWVAFGPAMNSASGQVQVTSSQVSDQTDYMFKVVDPIGEDSTTTFYDISGPSPISGFYKERPSDGSYKLHWKNPGDTDFDKVVIYKGDTLGFSADANHEIARVSGGPNSDMTYEDVFAPDAAKTYYYVIRALDHAGNSSSLAGDEGTSTQVLGTSSTPVSGKVTILPKTSGTVLGTEATPGASASPEVTTQSVNENPGLMKWILTNKKLSFGIGLVLLVAAYGLYRFGKKNK